VGLVLTPPRQPSPSSLSLSFSRASVSLSFSLPLSLSPLNLHVHPVNYFVSGYLQRAVNSCRADYTDRFIALVSQSNVRNAPIPTTHSPSLVLFLSSFTLPYFLALSLSLSFIIAMQRYFSHISRVCIECCVQIIWCDSLQNYKYSSKAMIIRRTFSGIIWI